MAGWEGVQRAWSILKVWFQNRTSPRSQPLRDRSLGWILSMLVFYSAETVNSKERRLHHYQNKSSRGIDLDFKPLKYNISFDVWLPNYVHWYIYIRIKCMVYVHTHTHTCTPMHTHTHIHTHIHTYIHTLIHVYTCMHACIHIKSDIWYKRYSVLAKARIVQAKG